MTDYKNFGMEKVRAGISEYLMAMVLDDGYGVIDEAFTENGFWDYLKTLNLNVDDYLNAIDHAPQEPPFDHICLKEETNRRLAKQLLVCDERFREVFHLSLKEAFGRFDSIIFDVALRGQNLEPFVKDFLSFGDTGTRKGQTLLTIMERNGLKNPVYVGDTQGDADACREAGISIIYASFGFGKIRKPIATLKEFGDLKALF